MLGENIKKQKMLIFKLALKNLIAAGLRTWLSVSVMAFAYILIIFYNGMLDGWNDQAKTDSIAWEFGHGQLWQKDYDPYDPFTLQDAHSKVPEEISKEAVPILIRQASIYPQGRLVSVMLKGIPRNQDLLDLPTQDIPKSEDGSLPVIIGTQMARTAKLETGDKVLMRWRDKNGTFDALEITVAGIFKTNVPAVDAGTIWISMEDMSRITGFENEATYLVLPEAYDHQNLAGWELKTLESLLEPIDKIIASKKVSGYVIYVILLGLALLAIFDTQVLSIFRRQKEIGTYVALGMTRWRVVRMFTIEGAATSILAAGVGAVVGAPLFIYFANEGISLGMNTQSMGITIAERMMPTYGIGLIVGTIVLVVFASTIVSFWPSKKIANMDPTLALKGKIQ